MLNYSHKKRKDIFLSENDFETVLVTFCCCEYGYVCYDLLKRQNQHLFLTIDSTYNMNYGLNETKKMHMYLKNQTEKYTVVE